MLRIALIGAGRMGQAIVSEIATSPDLILAGVCVREGGESAAITRLSALGVSPDVPVLSRPQDILRNADVVVDFSLPDACESVANAAGRQGIPLVCGLTGIDARGRSALRDASAHIPVLYERNMSLGIAVMQGLVRQAASVLGSDFSASIAETHHRHKRDAPSGTALQLGEVLAAGRGQPFDSVYYYDQDGTLGPPAAGDIVYSVTRQGENPGEHSVIFASDNEVLELTHRVTNRRVFAQGALRAAAWLVSQPAGYYGLSDLVA
ncbi:MAG: 4-hydroxy-tetrahydrodipicolinate reductase [Woeseiaceae bacterium]|nr:4-hydroxy-tetrahydrodipicolinate reductase [Woeseiaceae bacterium]